MWTRDTTGANDVPPAEKASSDTLSERHDPLAAALALSGRSNVSRSLSHGTRHTWWSLSRRGHRRFLIPTQEHCRIAASQLVSTATASLGARIALALAGWVDYPSQVAACASAVPLDDLLARHFPSTRLRYAVHCGTPSVYEKHTIQCIDERGRAVAYVKLSVGPEARDAMANEVRVLQTLARDSALAPHVPRVLGVTEAWGSLVSILAAPPLPGSRAPKAPPGSVIDFARLLFRSDAESVPWSRSPVRQALLYAGRELSGRRESEAADLLQKATRALDADFGDVAIPHGRAHGDLVPWNIRLSPAPYVFDWEWSRQALPFYDMHHYLLFPALLRRDRPFSSRSRDAKPRSPILDSVLRAASPPALPFPSDDMRWRRAYLSQAYAFYARSTAAASSALATQPLLQALHGRLAHALAEY